MIRAMFRLNLAGKTGDAQFNADMTALLRSEFGYRPQQAAPTFSEQLISFLPSEPQMAETEA